MTRSSALRRGATFALAAALLLAAALCAAAKDVSMLGPRDILQISVYLQPDLSREVRIDDEGRIALPLVGSVEAAGLTVERLTEALTVRYREYLTDPQLSIVVKEYHRREVEVSVVGEVARPGRYSLAEGSTLVEALSSAGGLREESGNRVVVLRRAAPGEAAPPPALVVDAAELFSPEGMGAQNPVLRDGDTVNVPRAAMYFVSGAVVRPGEYKFGKGATTTVLKAVSQAGGFTERAARDRLHLLREQGTGGTRIAADLESPLQPGDTLVVPEIVEIEVAVLGEVARPGRYRLPERATVIEALSQAGGLTKESGDRAFLLRPGEGGREPETHVLHTGRLTATGDAPGLDFALRGGDTVSVPRVDQYFILGAVVRPGAYRLEKGNPLTVLKAISLAGGFAERAAKKGVQITREEGDRKLSFTAELDALVRPQDIIIVPESFF